MAFRGTGVLNILEGGRVESEGSGRIGREQGSLGTVTVSGVDAEGIPSTWEGVGQMQVGYNGRAILNIEEGAVVMSDEALLGYLLPGEGEVSVSGTDADGNPSRWLNDGALRIGPRGDGSLVVSGGGQVFSHESYVAAGFTARNSDVVGTATVSGAGSRWILGETDSAGEFPLTIGDYGTGVLLIEDGGSVASSSGFIGIRPDSDATVTVRGSDSDESVSSWTNQDRLHIAERGTGALLVEAGAKVAANRGAIALEAGSVGVVEVSGTAGTGRPSIFELQERLEVGSEGLGTLTIEDGSEVTVQGATQVGVVEESAIYFSDNTVLTTGSLLAAPDQLRGTGTIFSNGLVSDIDLVFDQQNGLQQSILIDGSPDQQVQLHLDAEEIGIHGAGYRDSGSLTIADGLRLLSEEGIIGYHSDADGEATVQGPGSSWENSGFFSLGRNGAGVLWVEQGGYFESSDLRLGLRAESQGMATISGTDGTGNASFVQVAEVLAVGQRGSGVMEVSGGGHVSSLDGFVGWLSEADGSVTVWGSDGEGNPSTWMNSGELHIAGYSNIRGLPPPTAMLTITDGGQVSSAETNIGLGPGATGTALVGGPGSQLITQTSLTVGRMGNGELIIEQGAEVSNGDGFIGRLNQGNGEATVRGEESRWINTGSLYVGGSQDQPNPNGTALLLVKDSGTVLVSDELKVWSNGTVILDGGSLEVNELDTVAGSFAFERGVLTVHGPVEGP